MRVKIEEMKKEMDTMKTTFKADAKPAASEPGLELERLQAEVASLRRQLAQGEEANKTLGEIIKFLSLFYIFTILSLIPYN
jgi:Tfp pilus assembly protein PilO